MASYGSAATNGYGVDGLRVWRTQGGVTTYYIYDDDNPVVELSSGGALVALNTFGDNGLISRSTGTAATAKHFYAFDPQGSPSVILDGTGTQLAAAETDAFGKSVYTSNVSSDPYTGFGSEWGYYSDASTGLELLGHRFYDLTLGRFVNRDPIGYEGGIDLYAFCEDSPVDNTDETGFSIGFMPMQTLEECEELAYKMFARRLQECNGDRTKYYGRKGVAYWKCYAKAVALLDEALAECIKHDICLSLEQKIQDVNDILHNRFPGTDRPIIGNGPISPFPPVPFPVPGSPIYSP